MIADLWGLLMLGRSPWGDPKDPLTTEGIMTRIAEVYNKPLLTDEQITALAADLAVETSAEAIETALRNVLKKGVDNAG